MDLAGESHSLEKSKTVTMKSAGQGAAGPADETLERRDGTDRRKNHLRALFYGSFNPRRRGLRRDGERGIAGVD